MKLREEPPQRNIEHEVTDIGGDGPSNIRIPNCIRSYTSRPAPWNGHGWWQGASDIVVVWEWCENNSASVAPICAWNVPELPGSQVYFIGSCLVPLLPVCSPAVFTSARRESSHSFCLLPPESKINLNNTSNVMQTARLFHCNIDNFIMYILCPGVQFSRWKMGYKTIK